MYHDVYVCFVSHLDNPMPSIDFWELYSFTILSRIARYHDVSSCITYVWQGTSMIQCLALVSERLQFYYCPKNSLVSWCIIIYHICFVSHLDSPMPSIDFWELYSYTILSRMARYHDVSSCITYALWGIYMIQFLALISESCRVLLLSHE